MKRPSMLIAAIAAIAIAAIAMVGSAQAADGGSLGIGVDYSSGKYGTDITTEILSVPVTARFDSGNWSLRASLPWVRVSGDPNVLPTVGLIDNLNPIGRGRTGIIRAPTAGDPAQAEQSTTSGVGDLTLAATYSVPTGTQLGLDLGVNAKIATADENKSLGTGANDYGVTIDLYRDFDGTMLFGGVGHTWLGSSTYIVVGSVNSGNIGISQAAGRGRVGMMYEHRTATTSGLDDRRDLVAFYNVPTTGNGRFQVYASGGQSDGSPDWGAGISISTGF